MRTLLIAETAVGAAAMAAFVVRYLFVPRWYRTAAGRHMMALSTVLLVLLGMTAAARFVGGLPLGVWAAAVAVFDIILCGQVLLLFRAQRPTRPTPEENTMKRWLKLDAQNRAWRTVLQGVAVAVVFPALDAAIQVVIAAVTAASVTGSFDWSQVATTARYSAATAALMAIAAYLHRARLDPSPIPSAIPPEQPPPAAAAGLAAPAGRLP